MTKHNKKRNVGIVYELLLNYISSNLIESNEKKAKKATKLIEKHFRKGTELYKEFRLFNALAKSKVNSTHAIASILNEAKIAANNLDVSKLDKEKSKLIRDINYRLGKEFYYSDIKNYRTLGTIQLALNEWRKKEKDIKKLIDYETKIGEVMLNQDSIVSEAIESNINASHSDRLVLKLMTEKFNKRYNEDLTTDQKKIIENYVFYSDKKSNYLQEFFEIKKKEAIKSLSDFEEKSGNKHLLSKLDNVKLKVNEMNTKNINDENVVKFLSITKLIEELNKGE
jgi:hypothetical protein